MSESPLPSAHTVLPLRDRTILITRSVNQAPEFRQNLEALGATVLEMAALEIGPPSSWAALDGAIAQLPTFHWLILTSANGVQYFWERLQEVQGQDPPTLARLKIAVVGRKTAAHLQQRGLTPDFIPPNYIADALVAHFPEPLRGLRCLFPRVESGGRDVLVQDMTAQGATVIEVPAYESYCPLAIAPDVWQALCQGAIDVITFASSKTVEHVWQLLNQAPLPFGDEAWRSQLLHKVKLASIGPQTSQACLRCFGRVDIEAQEFTLEGLSQSIVQSYTL